MSVQKATSVLTTALILLDHTCVAATWAITSLKKVQILTSLKIVQTITQIVQAITLMAQAITQMGQAQAQSIHSVNNVMVS